MIVIAGKNYTVEELLELRGLIERGVQSLDDADALRGTTLYPLWEDLLRRNYVITAEDVVNGFRCQYNGVLYKVLQQHTVIEGYNPVDAVSLWAKVLIPDENVIPEWEQPESTNGYSIGDKVTHNGKTWESLINDNVFEPGVVGTETVWAECV